MVLESINTWLVGNALFGIILITLVISIITTLAYKFFTDQNAMKKLQDEIKKLRDEAKLLKENPKKLMSHNKEMMSKQMEAFKHNLKPMMITFIPIIIIFKWLNTVYGGMGDIFLSLGWLGNYIIFTIIFSFVLKKLLKVY